MKYIDAEKLIAEIERRIDSWSIRGKNSPEGQGKDTCVSRVTELSDLLSFINSLQQDQPEVDLEKEIDNYLSCSEDIEECADNEHYYVTKSALLSMARYFFIHGRLNAKKEE